MTSPLSTSKPRLTHHPIKYPIPTLTHQRGNRTNRPPAKPISPSKLSHRTTPLSAKHPIQTTPNPPDPQDIGGIPRGPPSTSIIHARHAINWGFGSSKPRMLTTWQARGLFFLSTLARTEKTVTREHCLQVETVPMLASLPQ